MSVNSLSSRSVYSGKRRFDHPVYVIGEQKCIHVESKFSQNQKRNFNKADFSWLIVVSHKTEIYGTYRTELSHVSDKNPQQILSKNVLRFADPLSTQK